MRQLGQLEAAVMQRVWDWARPVSVREVLEDLQRDRTIAYTTVMTVLDNLHGKGVVRRHKDGRAYLYTAATGREDYTAGLLDAVLSESDDRGAVLMRFVEHLSNDELAVVRQALETPTKDEAS